MVVIKPLHVGISVQNMDESIEWYSNNLNFEVVSHSYIEFLEATVVFMRNGNFEIELFEYKKPSPLPKERMHPNEDLKVVGTKHIAFSTTNLENLLVKFKEKNVDIVMQKVMDGNPMCFVRDNSGVLIEFIEQKSVIGREK